MSLLLTLPRKATLRERLRLIHKSYTASMLVSIPETINFGIIFAMHLTSGLLILLFQTDLRFVLFPIAGISSIIKAGLAWQRYAYDIDPLTGKRQKLKAVQAIWDTIQAVGVTAAVITGIIAHFVGASAVVGYGIAVTFSILLSATAIFQTAMTAYIGRQAWRAHQAWKNEPDDSEQKTILQMKYQALRASLLENLIGTGIVTLLCVGVTLAMVAGFPLVGGIIGVVTCVGATAYTIYNLYKHQKTAVKKDEADEPLLGEYTPPLSESDDEKKEFGSQLHLLRSMPPSTDNLAELASLRKRDRSRSEPQSSKQQVSHEDKITTSHHDTAKLKRL